VQRSVVLIVCDKQLHTFVCTFYWNLIKLNQCFLHNCICCDKVLCLIKTAGAVQPEYSLRQENSCSLLCLIKTAGAVQPEYSLKQENSCSLKIL
jgi:hypothetical protein